MTLQKIELRTIRKILTWLDRFGEGEGGNKLTSFPLNVGLSFTGEYLSGELTASSLNTLCRLGAGAMGNLNPSCDFEGKSRPTPLSCKASKTCTTDNTNAKWHTFYCIIFISVQTKKYLRVGIICAHHKRRLGLCEGRAATDAISISKQTLGWWYILFVFYWLRRTTCGRGWSKTAEWWLQIHEALLLFLL